MYYLPSLQYLVISTYFLVGIFTNGAISDCLNNLRVDNSSDTSIILKWDYTCSGHDSILFKVYWEHKNWQACKHGRNDPNNGPGRGNDETTNNYIEIPNLHPYSFYNFEVKANVRPRIPNKIPESKETIAETLQGVPDVKPNDGPINTKIRETELTFYWRPPNLSSCENFNGELDGYHVILKGIDHWNKGTKREQSVIDTSERFQNLMPYSDYNLYIYAKTAEGHYNPKLPFKIPAKTKFANKAGPPRDLTAKITNDGSNSIHITWKPPYPPTGEAHKYNLRWKPANSAYWSKTVTVESSSSLCSNNYNNEETNPYDKLICHTIHNSDLQIDLEQKNVTFQVSAFNAGSKIHGDWSKSVYPSNQSDDSENDENNTILGFIVIGSIVGFIFIVVLLTFMICKCVKRKQSRYKNVPAYISTNNHQRSSIILNNRDINRPNSFPPPWTPPSPRRPSQNSNLTNNPRYQHLLLPNTGNSSNGSRPGSIQETPLPPLPMKEPIYQELSEATLLRNNMTKSTPSPAIRVSFNDVNKTSDDEEEFLKPTNESSATDSDGYLTPSAAKKRSGSLHDEEYLAPTFNQFKRINSRDLTPPHEDPPPIPMESYISVRKHSE